MLGMLNDVHQHRTKDVSQRLTGGNPQINEVLPLDCQALKINTVLPV